MLEALTFHPWLVPACLVASGLAFRLAVTAPLKIYVNFRRPGDCPRCNGTGREPLK